MMFFRILCLAGLASCYRCGAEITSYTDVSLDHKKPWRGVSPDLHWDLDNVAVSHKACNYADGKPAPKRQGTFWCRGC